MKIYLSGRISGLSKFDYETNFKLAWIEAEKYLKANNLSLYDNEIINPLRIEPFFGIRMWFAFMINDLRALSKCDMIFMQPNWKDSRGACIEHYFAKFIYKIEIKYL